jgi:hypothetical protein
MEKSTIKPTGMFLTSNGRKFILKLLIDLKNSQQEMLSENKIGISRTEASEREMSCSSTLIKIQEKIIDCQKKLKLPDFPVREQSHECLPGNGVKIKINGEPLYVVIDGVCVCKHKLPKNHAIISAQSPLGEAIIGKKVNESGNYKVGNVETNFTVEKIDLPSKAKWIFKYDNALKEKTELAEQPETIQN